MVVSKYVCYQKEKVCISYVAILYYNLSKSKLFKDTTVMFSRIDSDFTSFDMGVSIRLLRLIDYYKMYMVV